MEERFDPANHAVLDLEQLGDLPGPVDLFVIEEAEGEHDAPLAVDGDEPAIPNPRHDALQRVLESLLFSGRDCMPWRPGGGQAGGNFVAN
jgi:hypothetical protein